jgi:hypothetical protein
MAQVGLRCQWRDRRFRHIQQNQAGVIVVDYATVAVEMLKVNASPKAGPLYGALGMPFAVLVGQLAGAFAKR